jgi:serine/threonine protein kinase
MDETHNPLDEYTMLSVIGKGSYAKVVLVRSKTNGHLYAMKSMKKKYIEKKNQVHRIMTERNILTEIDNPFLIKIHASFQNEKKLYLVLEYCQGGELFGLLSKRKRLTETEYFLPLSSARFYAAQILLALEYLHSKNIIYRE